MKRSEVQIGGRYVVRVSGKLVPVRIVKESPYGGWIGHNTETGREVHIKSAARLRAAASRINLLVEQVKSFARGTL